MWGPGRGTCQSSAACPGSGQVSEYRTGSRDRDYVHVVDLAEGHVRALQHVLAPDKSVNTGKEGHVRAFYSMS